MRYAGQAIILDVLGEGTNYYPTWEACESAEAPFHLIYLIIAGFGPRIRTKSMLILSR